jgi:hypothetical protein
MILPSSETTTPEPVRSNLPEGSNTEINTTAGRTWAEAFPKSTAGFVFACVVRAGEDFSGALGVGEAAGTNAGSGVFARSRTSDSLDRELQRAMRRTTTSNTKKKMIVDLFIGDETIPAARVNPSKRYHDLLGRYADRCAGKSHQYYPEDIRTFHQKSRWPRPARVGRALFRENSLGSPKRACLNDDPQGHEHDKKNRRPGGRECDQILYQIGADDR